MNCNRRNFFKILGAGAAALSLPPVAQAAPKFLQNASLRGSLDASLLGIRPGAWDDQSKVLQKVLEMAAKEDKPLFLPPGVYIASNLKLPSRTRITGVPGASKLVYGGGGHFLTAENCDHISLSGLVIDGANHKFLDQTSGLIHGVNCRHVEIDNCDITGSLVSGVRLERSGGRIERSRITGAGGDAGIYSVESTGLQITNNVVSDCANGGILIHRWTPGEDNSIVMGNRVERIKSLNGGTGQWGNGINVFRAHSVMVANNRIADCAFSAVRSNGGNNVQIVGNNCSRLGETALYSEFEFEGAVITGNIVDEATIGISVANFLQGGRMSVVANNLVRNLKSVGPYAADQPGFGIGISVEADTSVTSNVIENAPLYGINLGWGPYLRDVIANANVIRNAGEGIAVSVVKGAGGTLISNNVIRNAPGGGIVGHEWAKPVTSDLAQMNDSGFEHLTIKGNRVS